MRKITFRQFLPAIGWFLLITVLISTPGNRLPRMGSWFDLFSVDKMIHLLLFLGLAVLSFLPFWKSSLSPSKKKDWLLGICLGCIAWGFGTELIQKYFVPKRSFDMVDLAANALGVVICGIWFWIRLKKTSART